MKPHLAPPQVSAGRYEASVGALPDDGPHRVVTITGDSVGGLIRQISGALEDLAPHPARTDKQSTGLARHSMGPAAECRHQVRPQVGFSCNRDGSRMPLGPHIEFKIIGEAGEQRLAGWLAGAPLGQCWPAMAILSLRLPLNQIPLETLSNVACADYEHPFLCPLLTQIFALPAAAVCRLRRGCV